MAEKPNTPSRRAMLAGLAAAPVAGLPAIAGVDAQDDPIFAAISEIKRLREHSSQLGGQLEDAEFEAGEAHGRCPWSLIAWRNYSAIGGCEIERARDEFLELPDADLAMVEKEYQDAKKRELEAERAEMEWYERAGIATLRMEYENSCDMISAAYDNLATMAPSTPAGAAALLDFIADEMQDWTADWHNAAIATVANALRSSEALS
ncbi:MAG: hypothetical protein U1E25_15140 [Methylocystis sp.]